MKYSHNNNHYPVRPAISWAIRTVTRVDIHIFRFFIIFPQANGSSKIFRQTGIGIIVFSCRVKAIAELPSSLIHLDLHLNAISTIHLCKFERRLFQFQKHRQYASFIARSSYCQLDTAFQREIIGKRCRFPGLPRPHRP